MNGAAKHPVSSSVGAIILCKRNKCTEFKECLSALSYESMCFAGMDEIYWLGFESQAEWEGWEPHQAWWCLLALLLHLHMTRDEPSSSIYQTHPLHNSLQTPNLLSS